MIAADPLKHGRGYGRRDETTGMLHGHIRWPDGRPPTPFGCRWCGIARGWDHCRLWIPGRGFHVWQQPTQAQILARMKARRNARKAVCRCPQDDEPRPFAPVFDPYMCEASDCHGHTSETDPFGGGSYWRSALTRSAKVSCVCGCGWRTSVWHVNDGSAEEELHGHVVRVHGGTYPAETGGAPWPG